MKLRLFKITLILNSFIFLTGFLPFSALLGPGLTIASSGNVYKASAQYFIDHQIKKKTGKNSLTHVKEEVTKQNDKTNLNEDLKELLETRVKIAHQKLALQNEKKKLNKGLRQLVEKRIKVVRKKLEVNKTNQ